MSLTATTNAVRISTPYSRGGSTTRVATKVSSPWFETSALELCLLLQGSKRWNNMKQQHICRCQPAGCPLSIVFPMASPLPPDLWLLKCEARPRNFVAQDLVHTCKGPSGGQGISNLAPLWHLQETAIGSSRARQRRLRGKPVVGLYRQPGKEHVYVYSVYLIFPNLIQSCLTVSNLICLIKSHLLISSMYS